MEGWILREKGRVSDVFIASVVVRVKYQYIPPNFPLSSTICKVF
jgi:hypothetical protein